MTVWNIRVLLSLLLFALTCQSSLADEGMELFEKKIRPLFVEKCYACHSAEAAKKRGLKGGLQLDTRAGIRAGGESGPAVVPGNVAESLIVASIRHESFEMPPGEKLPADVVANVVRWIELGAPDPREGEPVAVNYAIDYDVAREHWAYQPLADQAADSMLPKVRNDDWPMGNIDRYVLAKVESAGLQPAADAKPLTMLRRLCFDLTGLPPTLAQVERFEKLKPAEVSAAYESLVDELLASPEFGEHWARHWLDGIRYDQQMETSAYYRNWVIESINKDLPYNEFLRRQLAGDLMEFPELAERADAIIATQWLAYNGGEDDFVESSLEVLGQQVFGISFNCAKCHDHKFDAFSQEDYYALAGILTSSKVPKSARDGAKIPGTQLQVITLAEEDPKRIGDTYLLIGGDKSRRGELIPRRLPKVFFQDEPPSVEGKEQSGRLLLANWIGDTDQPLVARVAVNRVWLHLIGRGIVPSPNDFGTNGDAPTHPELLDYLASRLIEEKWSLKAIVRDVALCRTYRQLAQAAPDSLTKDQGNELYSRAIPKRLRYEQIMDQALAVAGTLELGKVEPVGQINKFPQQRRKDKSYGGPRLIYCRGDDRERVTFDGPDPELLTSERSRSVTAPQALFFLNGEMIRRLSEETSQRISQLATDSEPGADAQVEVAYRLLFARPPTAEEVELGQQFMTDHGLPRYVHTLKCTSEFIHLN